MKYLITLSFLVTSIVCSAQIKPQSLCGNWKFHSVTDLQGSIIDLPSKGLEFEINTDQTFRMSTTEFEVTGTWELKDSTLITTGTRSDKDKTQTEKMKVNDVQKSRLSFKLGLENNTGIILNLERIEE